MFRQKLKNSVKNKLMRDDQLIENFKTLIEVTIDLNDKLYNIWDDTSSEKIIKSIGGDATSELKHHAIENA